MRPDDLHIPDAYTLLRRGQRQLLTGCRRICDFDVTHRATVRADAARLAAAAAKAK
jgi:hypothetical protein